MILTHLEPPDKGGSFSMSRKIFHKSLHNSCQFFQIAAGGGVGYNSGTREALIKSARAVSERFFVQSRYRRRRNTVYISRFRYRRVGEKIRSQPQTIYSYYFSIKWLTPFYPANSSQAAGGGEKCMDLRFLRLRRWLLKQQPNKTVFNRFIEN